MHWQKPAGGATLAVDRVGTHSGGMKKVLVIDDEEPVRSLMSLALRQRGYEVIEAETGEEGIELAKRELPDVIICDIKMKGMDGYSTLAALRKDQTTAAIPFILTTGYADSEGMRLGMELGADDYLPKPFTIEGLYAAVETRLKKVEMVRQQAERKLADLRDNISLMLPHELRTPLNGILAYGEILTTDAGSLTPGELVEMGQVILESARRLQRLVENFLIYAQIELVAADPESLRQLRSKRTGNPGEIVGEAALHVADRARRRQDLRMNLVDAPVQISDMYLGKIAEEIVDNAFKFSGPGTPVELELSADDTWLTFKVTDRGRGMSPEQIMQIGAYMQFQRKVQEQQGLGLGLAISKRLAELHGGLLKIVSTPGQGTTVAVKLPLAKS